ncbi:MAG TPA: hypothetical protein VKV18_11015 [Chthonomonas sp.]|uniref:hypothetical protein n=1 Tax=Chthonomonas sp. TaxID=2282153 RepID=UPI002B4AE5E6|nr:hypothetical protein [Chthonomonas sp.]HLI49204.1 hypothetical protein [Chthonomonas sp.]
MKRFQVFKKVRAAIGATGFLFIAAVSLANPPAENPTTTTGTPIPITATPDVKSVQVEKIAVLPWTFQWGTKTSRETAQSFLHKLLNKMGIEEISEARTTAAWLQANSEEYDPKFDFMPSPASMLRVGMALGADWVMAPMASWHSRSIWVGLGPKTKSTCTVSFRIVDVKNRVVALDVHDLAMGQIPLAKAQGLVPDWKRVPPTDTIGRLNIRPVL